MTFIFVGFYYDQHYFLSTLRKAMLTIMPIKIAMFFCSLVFFVAPLSASPKASFAKDSFYYPFASLSLTDQYGKPFDIATLQGEVTLFNFIFTHCAWICPKQTGDMLRIYRALPREVLAKVRFVSVSVDPQRDTPQQLHEFASRLGANYQRWHFVRGEPQQTAGLIKALSLLQASEQSNAEQINHQTHLWLVGRAGRLMMRYDGLNVDDKRIAAEIGQLSELPGQ